MTVSTSPGSKVPYAQRRNHKPVVPDKCYACHRAECGHTRRCEVCDDYVLPVYSRNLPVKSRTYWRHLRRWHVAPWA